MKSFSLLLRSNARRPAAAAGFTLVDTTLLLAAAAVALTVSADRISHPDATTLTVLSKPNSAEASPVAAITRNLPASAAALGLLAEAHLGNLQALAPAAPAPTTAQSRTPDGTSPLNPEDLAEISKQLGIDDLESGGGLIVNVARSVDEWMARIDAVLAVQRELSGMPGTPR